MIKALRAHQRFVVLTGLLAVLGLSSLGYILFKSRAPVPFQDSYEIHAVVAAADGIVPGLGQPVEVAGVHVGSITGAELGDGNAVVTMTLSRSQVPRVYDNARVVIEPITPLKDMHVLLDPGRAPARVVRDGGDVPIGRTRTPAAVSDLLAVLDTDTRAFVTSLVQSLGAGTGDRAADLRAALRALGPTTAQARRITADLADRRRQLARLVTNVGKVTDLATRDGRLAELVTAANSTLRSIAAQDRPLRDALAQLPRTLRTTRATLDATAKLAREVTPAVTALTPPVRALPRALRRVQPFADDTSRFLSATARPFVGKAKPLLGDLAPAAEGLATMLPDLTQITNVGNYFLNELGYNPPGKDEGNLFWASFFFHNGNSTFGLQDAHGAIGRAMALGSCSTFVGTAGVGEILKAATGLADVCPTNAG